MTLTTLSAGVLPAAARLAASAVTTDNRMLPSDQVQGWLAQRLAANCFEVTLIPFADMTAWHFDERTGNLVHATGRFFSIEGLAVTTDYGPIGTWTQPIVNQPEVGLLGIIVKEFDGVLHCLMSAKMEPGNVNMLQISPTVQATRSNYTRAHHGSPTAYLEYFFEASRRQVLADVLQSEQGSWFYRKANRNMIVEVTDDIEVGPDFCWLTVGQVLALMGQDNMVNMDARTVLSCMPFEPTATGPSGGPWRAALIRSLDADRGLHDMGDLLSWFSGARSAYRLQADRIPLEAVSGWHHTPTEIAHDEGRYFRVMAASVAATNREVASWHQPLIEPVEHGLAVLLAKRIDGVVHLLMHVRVEPGYVDTVEMAPTLQCTAANYHGYAAEARPPYLDAVLAARPDQIRYSTLLSEEGGRFYHAQNRYQVIEVDEDFPVTVGPDFCWATLAQLGELLRHGHYLNVQARSLVTCLHSLWAAA